MQEAIATPEDNRSVRQQNLLRFQADMRFYGQMLRSLSLILPLNLRLEDNSDAITYLDILSLPQDQQQNIQQKVIALPQTGSESTVFRIILPQWQSAGDNWFSPWQIVLDGQGSPFSKEYLDSWKKLAQAYAHGDADAWNIASQNAYALIAPQAKKAKFYGTKSVVSV